MRSRSGVVTISSPSRKLIPGTAWRHERSGVVLPSSTVDSASSTPANVASPSPLTAMSTSRWSAKKRMMSCRVLRCIRTSVDDDAAGAASFHLGGDLEVLLRRPEIVGEEEDRGLRRSRFEQGGFLPDDPPREEVEMLVESTAVVRLRIGEHHSDRQRRAHSGRMNTYDPDAFVARRAPRRRSIRVRPGDGRPRRQCVSGSSRQASTRERLCS